ncbi:hypothetical protein IQ254_18565 [Nodosilinea sp. LEGE 07088]|uniref:hypothetical protein n=1 Tax=Nodosilinea sp. LEGE 07088 TaxID=2777968 RepID=UPI001882AE99|nr:hypothetical protein [Nodosilinea sp. LEGE 07088]MBE9139174.1 hypothetical protein [Nodosilinea sp. LEGE 07088]
MATTYVQLGKQGPYVLGPKASWHYWFYYEKNFYPYDGVMADHRILYLTPRPRTDIPEWNIVPVHTRLVLERQGNGFRYGYRALVENPTDFYIQFDFIITSFFSVG